MTDGLSVYDKFAVAGFDHRPHVVTTGGQAALEQLDHVHLVTSLIKRWLGGTHQGAVTLSHLQAYLDEFSSRFNRRLSRHRGKLFYLLMQQAVTMRPPHRQSTVRLKTTTCAGYLSQSATQKKEWMRNDFHKTVSTIHKTHDIAEGS